MRKSVVISFEAYLDICNGFIKIQLLKAKLLLDSRLRQLEKIVLMIFIKETPQHAAVEAEAQQES